MLDHQEDAVDGAEPDDDAEGDCTVAASSACGVCDAGESPEWGFLDIDYGPMPMPCMRGIGPFLPSEILTPFRAV